VKPIYLYTARRKAKLTQEQLELKSGVPQAVISNLENKPDARPSAETVFKLADALDVDPRALRFGQPDEAMAS
jgi:transcriptional regulator with XRE-family HTH domain